MNLIRLAAQVARRFWIAIVLVIMVVPAVAASPPNILFIYTDDQAAWALGHNDNSDIHTPNLDRLAAEGVNFSNFLVATPVCSPSRASLLTGRYGSEWGITDWITESGGADRRNEIDLGLDPSANTWVRDLANAGYKTALLGKWHLGTQDRFHPTNYGYQHFFGFRHGEKPENPTVEVGPERRPFTGLTVDVLTDEALRLIRERDTGSPFLISLHYREPHSPWKPVSPEDEARYADKTLTLPNPEFPDLDLERVTETTKAYYAAISGIDRNVGRILDLLDQLNLAESTLVVFTSDNGYNIGHHGLLHKGNGGWITNAARGKPISETVRPNIFDTSLRVPAIVRWKGTLPTGATVDRVISSVDWYPTLLAIAGLALRDNQILRGHNFLPLLRGETTGWDDTFYGEYSIHHYTEADLRAIRTPEWKLVRDFRRPNHDELYDLKADPGEMRNLIEDPLHAATVERLNVFLLEHMRARGLNSQSRRLAPEESGTNRVVHSD